MRRTFYGAILFATLVSALANGEQATMIMEEPDTPVQEQPTVMALNAPAQHQLEAVNAILAEAEVLSEAEEGEDFTGTEKKELAREGASGKIASLDKKLSAMETKIEERKVEKKEKKEKKEKVEKKEEAPLTIGSDIHVRNLWAFLGIITFLILFTILFEYGKEEVVDNVQGSPNEPIVVAIFSELTVLGFLALVTFLLGKFGLDHISLLVYGHKDVAEDKAKLGEILEQIHMVIFLVMVIFVFEALGMLWFAVHSAKEWLHKESQIIKSAGRRELVHKFHMMKKDPPSCLEFIFNTTKAREFYRLEEGIQFMLIRQEFIFSEKTFTVDPPKYPHGKELDKDFSFTLYLKKIMGQRLAEVVELPILQWIFLELDIAIILSTSALAHGSWQYLLWLWLLIAWTLLVICVVFRNKLLSVRYLLSHTNDGEALLETEDCVTPHTSPAHVSLQESDLQQVLGDLDNADDAHGQQADQQLELDAELQQASAQLSHELDALRAAVPPSQDGTAPTDPAGTGTTSDPVTEKTPLNRLGLPELKTPDVVERRKAKRAFYPPEIKHNEPRFLEEDLKPAAAWIPQCLKGEPATPGSAKEKMFNLFWFGRNEVAFQLSLVRFIFLGLSVYMSVFVIQIIPHYVAVVYDAWAAVLISFVGVLPGLLVYFHYIFDVMKLCVVTTSVEQMRNRRMVDTVVRHQKEARAIMMLRMVVAMNDDALSAEDKPTADEVDEIFESDSHSMLIEKMDKIFRAIDKDQSGELSPEEIENVFKVFGLEDVNKTKIESMVRNMNIIDDGRGSKDDKITRQEFIAWLVAKEKQAKRMPLVEFAEKCFKLVDKEGEVDLETGESEGGDNKLTVSEFQQSLKKMCMGGEGFDFNEVAAIVLELDNNDDNELDIEEFMKWVQHHESEDIRTEVESGWCTSCCGSNSEDA